MGPFLRLLWSLSLPVLMLLLLLLRLQGYLHSYRYWHYHFFLGYKVYNYYFVYKYYNFYFCCCYGKVSKVNCSNYFFSDLVCNKLFINPRLNTSPWIRQQVKRLRYNWLSTLSLCCTIIDKSQHLLHIQVVVFTHTSLAVRHCNIETMVRLYSLRDFEQFALMSRRWIASLASRHGCS